MTDLALTEELMNHASKAWKLLFSGLMQGWTCHTEKVFVGKHTRLVCYMSILATPCPSFIHDLESSGWELRPGNTLKACISIPMLHDRFAVKHVVIQGILDEAR